jgi:hypothetical protein
VETLRRVASGPVDVSTAIPIEELSQTKVLDWTTLLPHIPIIDVPLQLARDLLQGREYALVAFSEYAKDVPDDSVIYRLSGRDESCGIIRRAEGRWKYEVSAMPQFGLGK